ncbi:MAG: DUF4129 domain-containing protein [Actinobacteria bacterium]|nr:DUF4129 domain-containing protein [Actinomycetota bacterium]
MTRSAWPVMVKASWRTVLLSAAVLILVFLVALGGSRSLAHAGRSSAALRPPAIMGDLWVAFGLVAAVVVAGLVYALWGAGGRRRGDGHVRQEPPQPWWVKPLMLALALLPLVAVVTAVVLAVTHPGRRPARSLPGFPRGIPTRHVSVVPSTSAGGMTAHWWFWGLLAAVAAVAAAIMLVARHRSRAGGGLAPRGAPRPLPVMIEESLAEIEREPDPRRAVIRAYVGMEAALARHGMGRRPFEAPQEYLARVLGAIRVNAAAGERLTSLFQRARFSEHPVGGQMKQEAIAALATIRDELAAQPEYAQ